MKKLFLFIAFCIPMFSLAHGFDESELEIESHGLKLFGTLTMPAHATDKVPLVIIIAGSGPTDRNCNGQGFKSDAYKQMAEQFAMNRIATFRYDKRGIGKSVIANLKEEDVNFDNMILDAKAIISTFEKDARFNKITVAGHSEGSLVGMMAVGDKNKYISIAGISITANELLKIQLKGQLGEAESSTFKKLDSLHDGKKVTCDNPMLMSLLRPSVQPYMMSWFKLNPSKEIAKLTCPVLVVNGTKDLQVAEENAQELHKANKNSTLLIIPNMNHLLKEIESDTKEENIASYQKPELPISKKMIDEMILFILM